MKIVFFGDSVTEGCFELIRINGQVEILRDKTSCYATKLEQKLRESYPDKNLEFINKGISGNATLDGIGRIEADVLANNPDLVIMCFGLNDVYYRDEKLFSERLSKMFDMLKEKGITTIYMTPNMMNKYLSNETVEELIETAKNCADCQNSGVLDRYMEAGKAVALEHGFYVCDAYSKWKQLDAYGVDTTLLLCNHINHPSRKMHGLFADMLFDLIKTNNLIK